jgi:hypothetical protein
MPMIDPLAELAALLAPRVPGVLAEAAMARDEPAKYRKKFRRAMDDRNIERPDPWLALVIALDTRALLRPVDWKEGAREVGACVARLLVSRKLDAKKLLAFFDADDWYEAKTDAVLAYLGKGLSAHRLALIALDIGSDSHEIALLPWEAVAAAKKLARKVGHGIVSHAPKVALAKPLPKVPVAKSSFERVRVPRNSHASDRSLVPGALQYDRKGEVTLHHCDVWPPRVEKIATRRLPLHVVQGASGERILAAIYNGQGTVALSSSARGKLVDVSTAVPEGFSIQSAGFVGSRAVLLPTEDECRSGSVKAPLVWNGSAFRPSKSLPKVTRTPRGDAWFLAQGFARTGGGEDVLLWAGRGWVAKGDGLRAAFDLAPLTPWYEPYAGVPAAGDAFYVVNFGKKTELLLVGTRGKPKVVLSSTTESFEGLAPTPDGGVVVQVYSKDAKAPLLRIAFPERGEAVDIPRALFGVTRDALVKACVATEAWLAIGLLHDEIRAVPWRKVRGLPRRKL